MNAAADNAARGFSVFPLKPGEKTPATPDHASNKCTGRDPRCRNGHQGWEPRATTDPERIRRGWAGTAYNVGVACGPSNLVVIDLDMPKGDDGIPEDFRHPGINDGKDMLAWICDAAGMDFPFDTYIVQTPTGGWHLYFRPPEGSHFTNSASKIAPLIDTRANGGYVVGAGSVTAAGEYTVLYDQPVQPLPNWIARLLAPEPKHGGNTDGNSAASGPGRIAGLVRTVENAGPLSRKRNDTLFWAACTMAEFAPDQLDQLAEASARNGLDEREIAGTIASARRRVNA